MSGGRREVIKRTPQKKTTITRTIKGCRKVKEMHHIPRNLTESKQRKEKKRDLVITKWQQKKEKMAGNLYGISHLETTNKTLFTTAVESTQNL
jgi:hypothetical protein